MHLEAGKRSVARSRDGSGPTVKSLHVVAEGVVPMTMKVVWQGYIWKYQVQITAVVGTASQPWT